MAGQESRENRPVMISTLFKRLFDFIASVAFAIPLLVLLAVASILGGLITQGGNVDLAETAPEWVRGLNVYLQLNDIFHSWWYVSLLGLLCLSLLAVTIKRVPTVWHQRGRGVAAGVLLAHVGILLIIGAAIQGGVTGFRYHTRLVEGDVTILPGLPFVIKLDRFTVEYFPREAFGRNDTANIPLIPRRQESRISLFRGGKLIRQMTIAPGQPDTFEGIKFLADQGDIGWVFDLVVVDPNKREKVVPVLPWAAPFIRLGLTIQQVFAHEVRRVGVEQADSEQVVKPNATEVFLLEEGSKPKSLGYATEAAPLNVSNYTVFPWNIRPYTGVSIYRRLGTPMMTIGLTFLLMGLVINLYAGRRSIARMRLGNKQEPVP